LVSASLSYIACLFNGKGVKSVIKCTYARVGRTVYLKGKGLIKQLSQDGGFVSKFAFCLFDEPTNIRLVVVLAILIYPA
jgi:hypothetical protein